MKYVVRPSLFLLIFFSSSVGFSQPEKDSTYFYYNLATKPKTSRDLSSAFNFYKKAKEKRFLEKDTLGTIRALRLMAIVQKSLGYLNDSELSATEILKLLDNVEVNDRVEEAHLGALNHLGIISRLNHDYDKALSFFNQALKKAKNTKDSITVLNNKATVFSDQKNYKLAIRELSQAYSKSLIVSDEIQKARILNNLGEAEFMLKLPKAKNKLKISLEIRKKMGSLEDLYSSYSSLSKYYNSIKQKDSALYYANQAYKTAKQIKSASFVENALSNLLSINPNPKITEFQRLKDSLFKAREQSRNAYAFNKYNYEKKQKQLLESELKNSKDKNLYTILGSILVLFSLGIFYRLKTRHQKEKLKEIYNTETRISQKVHDELANDMYQLLQKIHQKSSLPKNNIVFELDNIYKRTRDISHEISSVNLDHKYYYLELKGMLDTYQNENVTITTIGLTKDILSTINDLKKIIVLRVLQELMINMEKHSKATQVVVSFKKSNNRIQVSYVDNGLGFNKKKHFKSNGLQNVENRIRAIKGNITFDTERTQGISITISLPI